MSNTVPPKAPRVKPPKDQWPRFILDMGEKPTDRWTIRLFEDYESTFWDPNYGWGFSSISYAWGYWHDRRTWVDSSATDDESKKYPAFDPKIKPTWKFPVLNTNRSANGRDFLDPVEPIFKIDEIKKTLQALGTRWIWWDWSCNAQGDNAELKANGLLDIQAVEVRKMRNAYQQAINGCLWLHTTAWARKPDQVKGTVQLLLEYVGQLRNRFDTMNADNVEALIGLLTGAISAQTSLTSVWSFQEGVLLGDPDRPYTTNPKLPSNTCLILDHNAERFDNEGGDLVQDVVAVSTKVLGYIVEALVAKANGSVVKANFTPFQLYCMNEETKARSMISRLIATGLVGYHYNNPITLLESKFCRSAASPWSAEADSTVRAILGAMDVDIAGPDLITAAKAKTDKETAEKAKIPPTATAEEKSDAEWAAGKAGDKAELDLLKPLFFKSLIATYQWRMLLLALDKGVSHTGRAWWLTILDLKRPPVASIGYYVDSGMAGLESMYQPRKPVPTTRPTGVFDLPGLTVSSGPETCLVVGAKPSYSYYDMNAATVKWPLSTTIFYEYIKGGTAELPGTVGLTRVSCSTAAAREEKFGKKVLLLPLCEQTKTYNVGPIGWFPVPKPNPIGNQPTVLKTTRCVVLADDSGYVQTTRNGVNVTVRTTVFKGIADFVNLDPANLVKLDKDLEIW